MPEYSKNKTIKFFSIPSILFSSNFLKMITNVNNILPFYHCVSDINVLHINKLYRPVSINNFIKDLNFISKNFRPASLKQINTEVNNSFFLSFDDGLSEVYQIVAPILSDKKIPCTFFVNTDFIDNKQMFYKHKISLILNLIESGISISQRKNIEKILENSAIEQQILNISALNSLLLEQIALILNINFDEYLNTQKPYLSSEQIKILISEGFDIALHGKNHFRFNEISKEDRINEVKSGADFLEKNYNLKTDLFAFPFTDFGLKKETFSEIYDKTSIKFTFGTAGIKKDSVAKNFQRIPMEINGLSGKKIIKTEFLLYFIKKIMNKHIIIR